MEPMTKIVSSILYLIIQLIDHKTSTYQESLKNQVASFDDANEENKQIEGVNGGGQQILQSPDRAMDQFEAQDDQKIAQRMMIGNGGVSAVYGQQQQEMMIVEVDRPTGNS